MKRCPLKKNNFSQPWYIYMYMYVCVCVYDQRVQDKVLHLQSVYSPWSALSLRQTAVICLKREKKKLFEGIIVLRNWCNALMKKCERAKKVLTKVIILYSNCYYFGVKGNCLICCLLCWSLRGYIVSSQSCENLHELLPNPKIFYRRKFSGKVISNPNYSLAPKF